MNSSAISETAGREVPAWGAVLALTLGVFGLVGAEFLPASLLTPMAADLGVSEGMAGQAVTATAAVGLLTALFVTSVIRSLDRRFVLLGFSVLLIVSNLMVAVAPDLPTLLAGRVLLGVALGGFWSLSAATIMRLVPEASVPRAISILMSGVSLATIFAAPLGSYLGDLIGWRNVFVAAAGVGVAVLAAQFATLPPMPARGLLKPGAMLDVLSRLTVSVAMLAILLVFTGHFAFFTYLRPFLETVTQVDVTGVSAILFGFGLATFAGNYLGAFLLERSMRATLAAMPLIMALLAAALTGFGGDAVLDAALVALWGLAFGAVPVAWSTWITRAVPDEAESAGGLFVASINLAIATGAAAGGMIFDFAGIHAVFATSAAILLAAALTIVTAVETRAAPRRA